MFFGYLSKNKISPQSISVIYKNETLSYSELKNRINGYAAYYKSTGIKPGDNAAVLSENSLEFIITIFSLWQIGAVPVLLNTRLLPKEIFELTDFTGCNNLISNLPLGNKTDVKIKIVRFPQGKFSLGVEDFHEREIKLEETAVIIFTSGSTGKPKGVMISFKNLIESASAGDAVFKHTAGERWLAALPFYHVGGFSIITRTILYGAALIIPESLNIKDIAAELNKNRPTLTSFVSTQLKRLIELGIKPNAEFKHVLLGGGFLDADLVDEAIGKGWNVSKSYGATETCSLVTALTREEFREKKESAGKALYSNQILIVDDLHEPIGVNSTGEVAVKGRSVAGGYINNPAETARKFNGDVYYTGDFGRLDEHGYLFIEARRNDLIITGGENVNPYEVEVEILKHPLIKDAAVFGLQDEEWGHIVAAGVVPFGDKEISLADLKAFLRDKLPGYKIPKKLFILNELPKTELGKVQKGKLKSLILNKQAD